MSDPVRGRFDSWKEIAGHLNCSEKTAQRWGISRGLPVHRVPGGAKSTVYAYRDELDSWLSGPPSVAAAPNGEPASVANPSRKTASRKLWFVAIAVALLAVAAFLLLSARQGSSVRLAGSPHRLSDSRAARLPPLLTDGAWVYFQQQDDDYASYHMTRVSLDGRQSRRLAIPLANPDPSVVAPDGSALLLRDLLGSKEGDEPLFLQPLPAGDPRRLGDVRAYDAAWTPDRRRLVFSRQRSVYLATSEGVVLKKLFDLPGRAYRFRWAPGSSVFRFTVYNSKLSTYRIWEAASFDASPHALSLGVDHLPQQCCGEFSPDGRHFFFQAMVDGFHQVFINDERSRLPVIGARRASQLTSGPLHFRSPLPTPDGLNLLVLSQSPKSEIVRFDATGRLWLPLLEGVPAAAASFSRDRRWLAFIHMPDYTLWRCRLPGCPDPLQLTFPPLRAAMPQWSPDGARIAVMARTLGQPWRAVLIQAQTGAAEPLIPGEGEEADPDWSPAGDHVVFGAAPNPDTGSESSLQVVDLRSGAIRTIPGSQGYHPPRWSPNGRVLAAVRAGTLELALFDFATSAWSPVPGARAGYLNWSPDGTRLFFLSLPLGAKPHIAALDVKTLRTSLVASFDGIRKPPFAFGDWVGLDPAGIPLALRDLSTEEILSWKLERR